MRLAARGLRDANYLPSIVDAEGLTRRTAERPEIDDLAVAPQHGVRRLEAGAAPADDLVAVVDRPGLAERRARQQAERRDGPGAEAIPGADVEADRAHHRDDDADENEGASLHACLLRCQRMRGPRERVRPHSAARGARCQADALRHGKVWHNPETSMAASPTCRSTVAACRLASPWNWIAHSTCRTRSPIDATAARTNCCRRTATSSCGSSRTC